MTADWLVAAGADGQAILDRLQNVIDKLVQAPYQCGPYLFLGHYDMRDWQPVLGLPFGFGCLLPKLCLLFFSIPEILTADSYTNLAHIRSSLSNALVL